MKYIMAILLAVAVSGCGVTSKAGGKYHGPLIDENGQQINPPTY